MKLSAPSAAPVHGGLDYEELRLLGVDPERVVDFSSNLNPFFPSSRLFSGICAGARTYPDAQYSVLRETIAAFHGVSPECVFAGNGASEIVHLVCRCVPAGGSVLIPVPTFSEYQRAARICGARVILCPARPDLRFSPEAIISEMERSSPDVVFLCNPNNPTGLCMPREEVERIAFCAKGSVVVIDESYADFAENFRDSIPLAEAGNVAVIRSLTKFYGIAGVRIGYAVASPRIVSALNGARPPWNVSSFACKVADAVFSVPEEVCNESRESLLAARDALKNRLENAGKVCLPTDTGFFLVKTPRAGEVRKRLLQREVAVRDCSSFGLPSHIRVSARGEKDCDKLVREWTETDGEG